MKLTFIISILFVSQSLWAVELMSSVPGISIGNTHLVSDRIFRGKSPDGKVSQLVKKKITDVIIFKAQNTNEIDFEIKELEKNKYRQQENIHYIPIQWKNLPPFQKSCELTLEALQILKAVNEDSSRKAFFHCTVGQDRTGILAGLWKMLLNDETADVVFQTEMCAHGYEGATPGKPESVIRGVKEGLTKIFIKIAYLIESKKIDLQNIKAAVCSYDFSSDEGYLSYAEERLTKLTCPLNINLK